jgi:hypothetical protein
MTLATAADTLRAVLAIVDTQPDYPWHCGAMKQQIREDITAIEALGLDAEHARLMEED